MSCQNFSIAKGESRVGLKVEGIIFNYVSKTLSYSAIFCRHRVQLLTLIRLFLMTGACLQSDPHCSNYILMTEITI